jgi:hypothetical protein
VIVRERDGQFVVFEQHEHARISGEMARRWTPPPAPFESAVVAVTEHDVAWRELDGEVLWDEERGRPFSFVDYPSAPKMRAYAAGIDRVEAQNPYAALLCSLHYATIVGGSENPEERRFARREKERQGRLRSGFSGEGIENLERNLRLLKVCDGLSLFVCLNEPGRSARLLPPYEGGFSFDGTVYRPGWEDEQTLTVSPSPFPDDFEVSLPYGILDGNGSAVGDGEMRLQVRGRRSN